MLQREQDTPGGRAREVGGPRDLAQRHRRRALAEGLQQPQAAVEAFDKVGGPDLARFAFQLGHDSFRIGAAKVWLALIIA
jgi:hypothetical protein